jgi:hypothetical protein
MPAVQCSCGFTEDPSADYMIGDHLYEVFAPGDGKSPDGLVHLEGENDLYCMCGAGGSTEELDAHFLAVFTPAGAIARDGSKHERLARTVPAPAAAQDQGGQASATAAPG